MIDDNEIAINNQNKPSKTNIMKIGPYTVSNRIEYRRSFGPMAGRTADGNLEPDYILPVCRTSITLNDEIVATFLTDLTTIMDYVTAPRLLRLQEQIHPSVPDAADILRILNPYWAPWQFTNDSLQEEKYGPKMRQRMDVIRETGAEDYVLVIERAYVREDYLGKGVFKLYLDMMKELYGDCILWMKAEIGAELEDEVMDHSNLIQDEEYAYYLPEKWRRLIEYCGK